MRTLDLYDVARARPFKTGRGDTFALHLSLGQRFVLLLFCFVTFKPPRQPSKANLPRDQNLQVPMQDALQDAITYASLSYLLARFLYAESHFMAENLPTYPPQYTGVSALLETDIWRA